MKSYLLQIISIFLYSKQQFSLCGINGIHPLELAALAHQKFVFIHFVDGNGRVALLLMNQVLLHFEYPITIIPPSLGLEYIVAFENNL